MGGMIMKLKHLILTSFAAGALAIAAPTFANPPDNFGGNGQAWDDTSDENNPIHYTHKNGTPRMDWDTGRKAIPGNAGNAQANNPGQGADNSAIIGRLGNDDLVDPHRTQK